MAKIVAQGELWKATGIMIIKNIGENMNTHRTNYLTDSADAYMRQMIENVTKLIVTIMGWNPQRTTVMVTNGPEERFGNVVSIHIHNFGTNSSISFDLDEDLDIDSILDDIKPKPITIHLIKHEHLDEIIVVAAETEEEAKKYAIEIKKEHWYPHEEPSELSMSGIKGNVAHGYLTFAEIAKNGDYLRYDQ